MTSHSLLSVNAIGAGGTSNRTINEAPKRAQFALGTPSGVEGPIRLGGVGSHESADRPLLLLAIAHRRRRAGSDSAIMRATASGPGRA